MATLRNYSVIRDLHPFEIQLPRNGQHAGRYDVARYEVGFGAAADGTACTTWKRLYLRPMRT